MMRVMGLRILSGGGFSGGLGMSRYSLSESTRRAAVWISDRLLLVHQYTSNPCREREREDERKRVIQLA